MKDSKQGGLAGRLFLCLIGLLLMIAGGVFEWLLIRSYQNAKATREWPQVEAVVLTSEVAERQFSGYTPEFSARVVYQYSIDDQSLTSDRITPRGMKWSKDIDKINKQLDLYPVGRSINAWVNPEDKDLAILEHDTKAAGYTVWFPAVIILGGGGIIVGAFRQPKSKV